MTIKLNKETVEYIQEIFQEVLFANKYKTAPGIGNSLVFIKQAIPLKGMNPVDMEVSVRWTEEGSVKDYIEVYLKSYTKRRVYTSRYDLSLSDKSRVSKNLSEIVDSFEEYTKKFFITTLFKQAQEDRRRDFGHYLTGEKNEVLLSLKEIDRIDYSVYGNETLPAPTVYFTDGDSLSFDEENYFLKLTK